MFVWVTVKVQGYSVPLHNVSKIETYIPRNETAWPCSQFLHSCICEQFLFSHDMPSADRLWKYINRSQTHECGNWETEHYNSVLETTRPRNFISGKWECINRNQTFILDSHRPLVYSAHYSQKVSSQNPATL